MRNRRPRRRAILAGGVGLALAVTTLVAIPTGALSAQGADLAQCPWMDTSKTADERAQILLDHSTQSQEYRWLVEQPANTPTQTVWNRTSGGVTTTTTYDAALPCTPTVVYTDGPDGVRGSAGTTAWPAPIALASTWDSQLVYDKSAAQAQEAFAARKNVVLGPGIGGGRVALSGRNAEYLGEDPLLSGTLGAAAINGIQNDDDGVSVLADVKHYLLNEQETDRQTSSSNADERTIKEVYDLPISIALKQSDPSSIMCSYNQINGVYACEDPTTLNGYLKQDTGFQGYVMSDFGAVHTTAQSLNGGLDQELNQPIYYTPARLDAALAAGQITQAQIDEAAFRVVRAYIKGGLFDNPLPATAVSSSSPEHKTLAREAAEQSAVLLKNQGALPLAPASGSSIAVIGATASATATNGISAKSVCSMYNRNANALNCDAVADPLTAITSRAAQDGATVTFDPGTDTAAAATAAANAKVAVVFGYRRNGEFADASSLSLEGNGDALISAVAAANPNTIVVLETGSATDMPWLGQVKSVVEAWYPGEQQGPALSNLLFGDVNFSGKLPMTFPRSMKESPTSTTSQYPGIFSDGSTTRPAGTSEIRQVNYTEGLDVGYRWYDENKVTPLFPFGFGLSYTDFDYSDLTVTSHTDGDGALVSTVGFTVRNSGTSTGTEIPQLYATLPASADEPGKRLVGFDRVTLAPGESTHVSIDVDQASDAHPFGVWDTASHAWKDVAGAYTYSVASSSRDIRLTAKRALEFTGAAPVVTVTPSAAPTGDDGWYTAPVTLTASATDDVDATPSLEVTVDGSGWFATDGTIPVTSDGTHTIQVRATDDSGNVSDVVTTTVKLDRVAPQVAASSDGEARTITLTATDATSGVARIEYAPAGDPTAWIEYTGPIAAGRDAHTIVYRAIDVAGNVSETQTFDYSPAVTVPAVALTATPSKLGYGGRVALTATVPADARGTVDFFDGTMKVATSAVADGVATASVTPKAGTHRYTAQFSGDPAYETATSMQALVVVSKAKPLSVEVITDSVRRTGTQTVKADVGKLDNGTWPVGTVTLSIDGRVVATDKVAAADHGHAVFTLSKKRTTAFVAVAVFTPTDTANVFSKSSHSHRIQVK